MNTYFPVITPVRIEREGNPNYPLPRDYGPKMSSEGRRLARVNAVCQNFDVESATAGWVYFINRYLRPDPEDRFDPMFYKPPIYPMAPVHVLMGKSWFGDRFSAWAMPRFSAKSTTLKSFFVHGMCARRQWEAGFFKLKDNFVTTYMADIRNQLLYNRRIRDDFGYLKDKKGDGIWSGHEINSVTRCKLIGQSVQGGIRGIRLDFGAPDDVEQDEDNPDRAAIDFVKLRQVLLVGIGGMLDLDSGLSVIGTLVHRQSFLYYVSAPDEEFIAEGGRDPRFAGNLWKRFCLPMYDPDGKNVWSERYTEEFIKTRQQLMGSSFGSEFLNLPLSSQQKVFFYEKPKHEYRLVSANPEAVVEAPFAEDHANAAVTYLRHWNDRITEVSEPWLAWLSKLSRFVTVDYAYTNTARSDKSAIHVWGADNFGDVFSLALWSGKKRFSNDEPNEPGRTTTTLCDLIWEIAVKWRCRLVCVEAYPLQEEWFEKIRLHGNLLRKQVGWAPGFFPIEPPPHLDKGTKIRRIERRWVYGKIKLPAHLLETAPYKALCHQLNLFTEDLANLRNDDEIDTVGMLADVLKSPVAGPALNKVDKNDYSQASIIERVKSGEHKSYIPGLPLAAFINIQATPPDVLLDIIKSRQRRRNPNFADLEPEFSDNEGTSNDGNSLGNMLTGGSFRRVGDVRPPPDEASWFD